MRPQNDLLIMSITGGDELAEYVAEKMQDHPLKDVVNDSLSWVFGRLSANEPEDQANALKQFLATIIDFCKNTEERQTLSRDDLAKIKKLIVHCALIKYGVPMNNSLLPELILGREAFNYFDNQLITMRATARVSIPITLYDSGRDYLEDNGLLQLVKYNNAFYVDCAGGTCNVTDAAKNGALPCVLAKWQPFSDNPKTFIVRKLPEDLQAGAYFRLTADQKDPQGKIKYPTVGETQETSYIKSMFNMEKGTHYIDNIDTIQCMDREEILGKLSDNALREEPDLGAGGGGGDLAGAGAGAAGGSALAPKPEFLGDMLNMPADAVVTRSDIAHLMSTLKL